MFRNPFSFYGRIRRTEYGLSIVFYIAFTVLMAVLFAPSRPGEHSFASTGFIPAVFFVVAQGVKRCHDLGKSGWWILVPFYGFWLLFAEGQSFENEFGDSPKDLGQGFDPNHFSTAPVIPAPQQEEAQGKAPVDFGEGNHL